MKITALLKTDRTGKSSKREESSHWDLREIPTDNNGVNIIQGVEVVKVVVVIIIIIIVNKAGGLNQGWPEGSLFNSSYTEV